MPGVPWFVATGCCQISEFIANRLDTQAHFFFQKPEGTAIFILDNFFSSIKNRLPVNCQVPTQ